jgi:hypothetical protein
MALMQHNIEEMSAQLHSLTTEQQKTTPLLQTPTSMSRPASRHESRPVSRTESRQSESPSQAGFGMEYYNDTSAYQSMPSPSSLTGPQAASDADNRYESGRSDFSSDGQGINRSQVSASSRSWDGESRRETAGFTELMTRSSNMITTYSNEQLATLAKKRDAVGVQF